MMINSTIQDNDLRAKLVKATVRQETKLIHEKNRFFFFLSFSLKELSVLFLPFLFLTISYFSYIEQELSSLSEMVYRMKKVGTPVKLEPIEERQKKLADIMTRLHTRQKAVCSQIEQNKSNEIKPSHLILL